MKLYIIFEILSILVLALMAAFYFYSNVRYRKLKKVYDNSKEKLTKEKAKLAHRLYPIVPKPTSAFYENAKHLLFEAGWNISVERFYIMKLMLSLLTFVFLVNINTTNVTTSIAQVVGDINYGKVFVDVIEQPTPDKVNQEKQAYSLVDNDIKKDDAFYDSANKPMYIEYVQNLLIQNGIATQEAEGMANRIYEKMRRLSAVQGDFKTYLVIFLFAFLMYNVPNVLGLLKIELIENKKNYEILNLYNIYSIYGSLPPNDIKIILDNMVAVSVVFKSTLDELKEELNHDKNVKVFDKILAKLKNDDLYELLEFIKMATFASGITNSISDCDKKAAKFLQRLDIDNRKRREKKEIYATIPTGIMFLLCALYFMYGIAKLSNPANMMANF